MKGRQMKKEEEWMEGGHRRDVGEGEGREEEKKIETERFAGVAGSGAGQPGADGGYLQFFTQNRTTEAQRLVALSV